MLNSGFGGQEIAGPSFTECFEVEAHKGIVPMNMQKLLQMGQQMQTRMTEIQESLGKREITASSGGGMVTVTVNGKGDVAKVQVDPTVVDPKDVEMLEDLILAAISEAQGKARGAYEEEMKKVMGGLPFPMKIPGLF